jgi:hypothetical protein
MKISILLLLLAAPDRVDLVGHVRTAGEFPVEGANIVIYTASPRHGTSTLCPSCYPDCSKMAQSAGDGSFRILSLDPDLVFRVLIVSEHHR